MNRRQAIGCLSAGTGAILLSPQKVLGESTTTLKRERILRIAHITDVHITLKESPDRFLKCLEIIKQQDVDFFLNGGDTIMDASNADVTRDHVNAQWDIWSQLRKAFSEYDMYSCLGNHDMWWASKDKTDYMYGKDFAQKQLEMPHRY